MSGRTTLKITFLALVISMVVVGCSTRPYPEPCKRARSRFPVLCYYSHTPNIITARFAGYPQVFTKAPKPLRELLSKGTALYPMLSDQSVQSGQVHPLYAAKLGSSQKYEIYANLKKWILVDKNVDLKHFKVVFENPIEIGIVNAASGIGPVYRFTDRDGGYVRHEVDSDYVKGEWLDIYFSSCGGAVLTNVPEELQQAW